MKARRKCSICRLPTHDKRAHRRGRRNPFDYDKPVYVELKQHPERDDVWILDQSQGNLRKHFGTVEGWRAVTPFARAKGYTLDDLRGSSYLRQHIRRHAASQRDYITRHAKGYFKEDRYDQAPGDYARLTDKIERNQATVKTLRDDVKNAKDTYDKQQIRNRIARLMGAIKGLREARATIKAKYGLGAGGKRAAPRRHGKVDPIRSEEMRLVRQTSTGYRAKKARRAELARAKRDIAKYAKKK